MSSTIPEPRQETHPEMVTRLQRFAARQPMPASQEDIAASMPIQREAGRSAKPESPVAGDQVQVPVPASALPHWPCGFRDELSFAGGWVKGTIEMIRDGRLRDTERIAENLDALLEDMRACKGGAS